MDSRDSGCFNSILSNNTNASNIILKSNVSYNESTPIKNQLQTSSAVNSRGLFDSPNSSCLTPIKSRRSDAHTQASIDIDSVYFSQLKRYKHSSQFSPRTCSPSVSSFGQRLRLGTPHQDTSYSSYSSYSTSENSLLHVKIDFLSELNERSMFHVSEKILSYLSNKDYVRVSQVSKNWQIIYNNDLNLNKQRRQSIKHEIEFRKSEKVNKLRFVIDYHLFICLKLSKGKYLRAKFS